LNRLLQRAFVADRTGQIRIISGEVGIIGQNPQRHARVRAVDRAADVAGIKQLSPVQDADGALPLRDRLHLNVTLQVRPGCKTVFMRNA
jgi:hypothetical protein